MSWVTEYSYDGQISYETKSESESRLKQKIATAVESIFLVQILRDLSNLKDQIKKK